MNFAGYDRFKLSGILANAIMYGTKHLYLIVETVYRVVANQYLCDTAAP